MTNKPKKTPITPEAARTRFAYTDPNDIVILKYGKPMDGKKKKKK